MMIFFSLSFYPLFNYPMGGKRDIVVFSRNTDSTLNIFTIIITTTTTTTTTTDRMACKEGKLVQLSNASRIKACS